MNKHEYLSELKKHLSSFSEEERKSALDFYEEYFEDAGEGREADIIAELGDPEKLAETIKEGSPKEEHEQTPPSSGSFDLDSFKSVQISVICSSVEFIPSDRFHFELKPSKRTFFEKSFEGGNLTITERKHFSFFSFGNYYGGYVKVYYPAKHHFESVSVRSVSADVSMSSLAASDCAVDITSGSASLRSIFAPRMTIKKISGPMDCRDCIFENLTFKNISGSNIFSGCETGFADMNNTSGRVEYSGKITKALNISSVSGDMRFAVNGHADEYSKDVTMMSGSLVINGVRMKGYKEISPKNNGKFLRISSISGDIELIFVE